MAERMLALVVRRTVGGTIHRYRRRAGTCRLDRDHHGHRCRDRPDNATGVGPDSSGVRHRMSVDI